MAKNLALFFDGTWRRAEPLPWLRTNCRLLYEMVIPRDQEGAPQQAWYDEGVGARWYERVQGGLLGTGLDVNIQQGYKWLARRYREGDRIFLFGFSRGAYTARSLAGLLRKCGLLRSHLVDEDHLRPHESLIKKAYEIYRRRDSVPDTDEALDFRERSAQPVKIRMLGVFDTVGSMGVPKSFERLLEGVGLDTWAMWVDKTNREHYRFHDQTLSGIIENAFHALAIDEHREVFAPTLWEEPQVQVNQRLVQLWFPGAHSDVGGGYPDRSMANIPLRWMRKRAKECGLHLEIRYPFLDVTGYETLHDSWNLRPYNFRPRYYRPVDPTFLHHSTLTRLTRNPDYRPANPGLEELMAQLKGGQG